MESVTPKKSLGQNFLRDEKVLQQIINAAELSFTDNVLEIGPGTGVLTERLLATGGRVVAIEKDEQLAAQLRNFQPASSADRFPIFNPPADRAGFQTNSNDQKDKAVEEQGNKFLTLAGDILEINLPELIEGHNFIPYKVVANIPYYITGQIIRLFLETVYRPTMLVLLVQKEVAERICASAGNMSVLSVSVQVDADPALIAVVPRSSFYPVPEVDSAIIKMVMKPTSPLVDHEQRKKFFQLVKIGFSSRRKTLANNLASGLQQDKNTLEKKLVSVGLTKNIRAQELSVPQWFSLLSTIS